MCDRFHKFLKDEVMVDDLLVWGEDVICTITFALERIDFVFAEVSYVGYVLS